MLLKRENKENRRVVLTIQVEQEAWEKALEEAYERSKALFTKEDGSLPTRQEMEEKHGADVFYQDAVNNTFPIALVEAVRQEDISVAGAPELTVEAIGPEGYVFSALIDLYPEVKLGQYKGLSAPRPQVELSDDDVTAAIGEYLQNHLTEEHPEKAAMGDEVTLDFEGFVGELQRLHDRVQPSVTAAGDSDANGSVFLIPHQAKVKVPGIAGNADIGSSARKA